MPAAPDYTAPTPSRSVIFPADFLERPSARRLMRKWGRTVEWWMAIVLVAREALYKGHLLVGGQPLSLEDLQDVGRNPIDPEFIEALVSEGWIYSEGDALVIARWSEWYRPPSRMPEVEAERSKRRREATSGPRPEATADRPQATVADRTQPNRTGPTRTGPIPTEPIRSEPTTGPTRTEPASEPSGGDPPPPPGGSFSLAIAEGITPHAKLEFQRLDPGRRWTKRETDRLAEVTLLCSERRLPVDISVSLTYGVDQTLYELQQGKSIAHRWGYACAVAESRVAEIASWREGIEWAAERGYEPPEPYAFRPQDLEVTVTARA
jgi:hypothetical protein